MICPTTRLECLSCAERCGLTETERAALAASAGRSPEQKTRDAAASDALRDAMIAAFKALAPAAVAGATPTAAAFGAICGATVIARAILSHAGWADEEIRAALAAMSPFALDHAREASGLPPLARLA